MGCSCNEKNKSMAKAVRSESGLVTHHIGFNIQDKPSSPGISENKLGVVKRTFSMDLLDVLFNVQSVLKNYDKGGLMRNSCLKCAMKHITQSSILLAESEKGYPNHYWYALGHLAEAEDELVKDFPELANTVRNVRIDLEKDENHKPDYESLMNMVTLKLNEVRV